MQPYFFPYIGYFHLINCTDKWIVFDKIQYIRHGWMNRNRILHPKSSWQYIVVPLKKHSRNTLINEIEISTQTDWKSRIVGQLNHYKKQAPYYKETLRFVEDCLANDEISLPRLNVSILAMICTRLDIQFNYSYFSEMDINLDPIEEPGDWALEIAKAMAATEYINPPGGVNLFNHRKFKKAGIKLTISKFKNFEYNCGSYEFIPALSIIDLFMWNSCIDIKKHLDRVLHNNFFVYA